MKEGKLEVGDLVVLKSDLGYETPMVVTWTGGEFNRCPIEVTWVAHGDVHEGSFPVEILKPIPASNNPMYLRLTIGM